MDYLRDFEFTVSAKQQVEHHALAFCYDAANLYYEQLFKLADDLPTSDVKNINANEVVPFHMNAWGVVESLESVRQILSSSQRFSSPNKELSKTLDTCNRLRRKKAHVAQNIKNIAKKTDNLPLFGVVKWTEYDPEVSEGRYVDLPILSVEPPPYAGQPFRFGPQLPTLGGQCIALVAPDEQRTTCRPLKRCHLAAQRRRALTGLGHRAGQPARLADREKQGEIVEREFVFHF